MSIYDEDRASAIADIQANGRSISIIRTTTVGPDYNPTVIESEPIVTFGLFLEYNNNEIDGTLILKTDKKIMMYDSILIDDVIRDGGVDYHVVSTSPFKPGDLEIFSYVQVRK